MQYIRVRIHCNQSFLERNNPLLIYGEAAVGKTLTALSLASWHARLRGGRVYLVTTEPQNTLPLASVLLTSDSLIYMAFSLEELTDMLFEITKSSDYNDVIVVDTLTAPYRVEASSNITLANRLLTFASSLLRRAAELGVAVIAVSQVHASLDGGEPIPPGYSLIREYFTLRVLLRRESREYRVGLDEDNNVIFKLVFVAPGEAELTCTQRYSSY